MNKMLQDLKLVKNEQYSGYFFDDVVTWLYTHNFDANHFSSWMGGQTAGLEGGKMVVYKWDLERYIDYYGR